MGLKENMGNSTTYAMVEELEMEPAWGSLAFHLF